MADNPVHALVVEDDPADATLINRGLVSPQESRFHITWAMSLEKAQQYLAEQSFQIILLDLSLPDSSGLDTLQRIHQQTDEIPIIVITEPDDEAMAIQAMRAGAQDSLARNHLSSERLTQSIRYSLERHRLLRELKASNERYALAAQGTTDGLWDWDLSKNEIYYSPRWKSLLGYSEEAIGNSPAEWFQRVYPADLDHLQASLQLHLEGGSEHFESEYRMQHRDGTYRWMLCRGLAITRESARPHRIVGSHTDISRLKLAEANLIHDAYHDPLTHLPNRQMLSNFLSRLLERARNHRGYHFAVLFLDLDGFKHVNDSLGHASGDQLLVVMARRLEECVRPGDLVARLGGDEFTILLDDISHVGDAIRVAERVHERLSSPVVLCGQEIAVSTSIGIACSDSNYQSPGDILRDADTALYRAKGQGKACHVLFDHDMHAQAVARLQLETDLRKALAVIEGGAGAPPRPPGPADFFLEYQPIISCATGEITGIEALVRWRHPQSGLLPPRAFIPLAEETGLIASLGRWVLSTACADARNWRHQVARPVLPSLCINLSGKELTRETVGFIKHLLDELHREGNDLSLSLELTESVLNNGKGNAQLLHDLRACGIQLGLDDFGTGFSCLAHLLRSPFAILKIAQSFISNLLPDGENAAVVRTIVALGKNLGLTTIAEGVETREQLQQLAQMGCDRAQGYLFSFPVNAEAITSLLRANPHLLPTGPK
jgi:diguanylate cyclase (GGDEF)-like protein/PAS domain S-box-containing protein